MLVLTDTNAFINQVIYACIPNKYTKWYCNIISRRAQQFSTRDEANAVLGYCEGHHILPKAFKMGGVRDKLNIVYLTAREHFIVHMLLVKMTRGQLKYKLAFALNFMCRFKGVVSSRTFYVARKMSSKYNQLSGIYGEQHPLFGSKRSEHCRKRLSEMKLGSKNHMHGKFGEKNHFFGKHHKDETKEVISQKAKERYTDKTKHPMFGRKHKKLICPHCNKECSAPNAKRWHFDNCKFSKE